jgi:predicted PurR-regulated permease PerM
LEIFASWLYNGRKGGVGLELNKKNLKWIFLGVAGCIVLYWLLHETERLAQVVRFIWKILEPFAAGAAIAFILNVPMRPIERGLKGVRNDGLRRALAIFITFVAVLAVLAGVVYLLIPQIVDTVERLVASLPGFFQRIQNQVNGYLADNPEVMQWLSEHTDFANVDWASLIQKAASVISNSLTGIVDKALTAVVGLSTGIFNAVISLVFAVYSLGRKEILARQGRRLVYAIFPERVGDQMIRVLRLTNSTFSNFISGQCLEAAILGAMFAISMLIFGMPYVPLVSVLIAVTALVPIVGAFVGCIVGAFFIMVESPVLALWFVVMFLVLQQIEGNIIYPRVMGTSIGLPGMWVLLAVAVGGELMGIAGMLLMIPLASVLYSLVREMTDNRLQKRGIDREKLQDYPPELKSGFTQKRERAEKTRLARKLREQKKKEDS